MNFAQNQGINVNIALVVIAVVNVKEVKFNLLGKRNIKHLCTSNTRAD